MNLKSNSWLTPSYPPSPSSSTSNTFNSNGFMSIPSTPTSTTNSQFFNTSPPLLPPTLKRNSKSKCIFLILILITFFGFLFIFTSISTNNVNSSRSSTTTTTVNTNKLGLKLEGIKEWSEKQFENVNIISPLKDLVSSVGNKVGLGGITSGNTNGGTSSTTRKHLISDDFDTSGDTIEISALPRPRLADINNKEIKYIGYLPHSGFHNQRSAFQNALMLGNLLNRTVLVPPIWIGWPTPTQFYTELQQTWNNMLLLNQASFNLSNSESTSPLYQPVKFHSTTEILQRTPEEILSSERAAINLAKIKAANKLKWESMGWKVRPDGFPISDRKPEDCKSYSAECRHTYKDTFLAWDFLANLDVLGDSVQVVDRWDMREKSLLSSLGVEEDDVYVFKDEQYYDFQFHEADTELIIPGSGHWQHSISLPALARLPQRVLLFGSLFGTGRIKVTSSEGHKLESFLSTSLAFRNPWLLDPAEAIRERLGGGNNYIGIHARVGDGTFLKNAPKNMEVAWRRVMKRLKINNEHIDKLWLIVNGLVEKDKIIRERSFVKNENLATSWRHLDNDGNNYSTEEEELPLDYEEKLHRLQRRAPINFIENSTLQNLTCRAPLYTSPNFLLSLNTPIYLATDSRSPETDENLSIFFKTFPCTFILSDFVQPIERNNFSSIESVGFMMKLINQRDDVNLGRLFLPFLEAMVAAMGQFTIGTAGSTFSTFAESGLSRAYRQES